MAVDMFLEIPEIPGESSKKGMEGKIDIESFNFGAVQHGSFAKGGAGGGAGKAEFQDINIVKEVDKSSPKLFQACAAGTQRSATWPQSMLPAVPYRGQSSRYPPWQSLARGPARCSAPCAANPIEVQPTVRPFHSCHRSPFSCPSLARMTPLLASLPSLPTTLLTSPRTTCQGS